MKLSIEWLRELVDLPPEVETICQDLTLLGLEVEQVEEVGLSFPGIVVGRVLQHAAHPNADRLSVCVVSDGKTEFPVVCGAPNVRQGLTVAFATPGSTLPDGTTIKKTKIRGEVSLGMICSERELGLGDGQSGILELDEQYEVGRGMDELFGWKDTCVEIEVTPNRPDWLSHIGVARELAAKYGKELRLPQVNHTVEMVDEDEGFRAKCEDEEACPRYTGRIVRGIQMRETPPWMRRRLLAIGQRPINAVVDCSNYLLHECGQPNHAFDLNKIKGNEIVVRRAKKGERCVTLDDQVRELSPQHLVIADREGPAALAGLMGGSRTEVSDDTSDLLLEVANFDPITVRGMRRDLGMNTDASYRFERGCDQELIPWVQSRLAELLASCCGGTASPKAFQALGKAPAPSAHFFMRSSQVERLLGVRVETAEMTRILHRLGISAEKAEREGETGLWVRQPSFRRDLLEEVDAIEEIARLYGYDKIPARDRAPMLLPARRETGETLRRQLRDHLAAAGIHEVTGSSFMESKDPDRFLLAQDDPRRGAVEVLNPLVAGEGLLKTTSLPEMLRIVDRNRRRAYTGPIRVFQLDRCFLKKEGLTLPEEPEALVVVWAGPAETAHSSREPRVLDPFDALGEIEVMLESLGIQARFSPGEEESYDEKGTAVGVRDDTRELGHIGMIHPRVAKAYGLEGPILHATLSLRRLEESLPQGAQYNPVPIYPPVRRDLSLLVPKGVGYGQIAGLLRGEGGELLESLDVFDLYEGKGIGSAARALGVRLVLRSLKGTLKDKRVDSLVAKILQKLDEELGVKLRAE